MASRTAGTGAATHWDAHFYQGVLDRHADEELTERLRRLGGLSCTGSVLVFDEEILGVVFLDGGRVIDAIVVDGPWVGEGVQAVAFLANMKDPELVYETTTHFGKPTIAMDHWELREQVEQIRPLLLPPAPLHPRKMQPTRGGTAVKDAVAPIREPAIRAASTAPGEPALAADPASASASSVAVACLRDLRAVYGYRASVVMDHTGDLLWSDDPDALGVGPLAGVYNDLFRSLDGASREQGLQECGAAVVHARKGLVVIHCAGADTVPHLHAVAVLKPDGNQALMRICLKRDLARIRDALV